MRKGVALLVVLALVLSSCSVGALGEKEIVTNPSMELFQVLANERPFVFEETKEYLLSEFMFGPSWYDEPSRYCLVDFDADGENEMVIEVASDYNLVLHRYEGRVYGFLFYIRWMSGIKADGTYMGSSSFASSSYLKLRFEGSKYIESLIASSDMYYELYQIGGQDCTSAEFDVFRDEWVSKPFAMWRELKPNSNRKVYGNLCVDDTTWGCQSAYYICKDFNGKEAQIVLNADGTCIFPMKGRCVQAICRAKKPHIYFELNEDYDYKRYHGRWEENVIYLWGYEFVDYG